MSQKIDLSKFKKKLHDVSMIKNFVVFNKQHYN